VLFDFGGTLFSYRAARRAVGSVIFTAAEEFGVEAERRELGRHYMQASRAAWETYAPRPYYLHRDVFLETYRGYARALGHEPSEEWLERTYTEQRDHLIAGFELRSDCLEVLERLRGAGLHVSIVSNIDDDYLDPMIAKVRLGKCLDARTSSEEAQSCKPDAGIYKLALEKAGCEAARALFVGDSVEADIAGAQGMSMPSALISEEGGLAPNAGIGAAGTPDHRITELSELLAIVGA